MANSLAVRRMTRAVQLQALVPDTCLWQVMTPNKHRIFLRGGFGSQGSTNSVILITHLKGRFPN